MTGLPQHARFIRHERDAVVCYCPCGWRVRLAVREEAAARFREHMATVNTAPTPDRFMVDLSVKPGIAIPPLTLLVSCLVGLAMWVAIGVAVIGVLR